MRYVPLGRSGLIISEVGLGTMQFGWSIDEPASFDVLDAFADAGGTFIDSADIYSSWSASAGGPPNDGGVSEEIIGRWMAQRSNRDQVVIATKVRGAMGRQFSQGRDTPHQREGLGRKWVTRACEDSLRRLQVDHIDLYQLHWADPLVPIEETLGALDDLVRRGWVRHIGTSNFSAWRIVEALWASDRHNLQRFISEQPEYNLLQPQRRDVEAGLADMAQKHGIGLIPYSPLGGGLLTGKYRRGQTLPDSVRADNATALSDQNWAIIERLVEVADEVGRTPAQTAIGWMMAKPFITAPIVGANRPDQLRDTLAGIADHLPAEAVAALDQVSAFERSRAEAGE